MKNFESTFIIVIIVNFIIIKAAIISEPIVIIRVIDVFALTSFIIVKHQAFYIIEIEYY